MASTCSKQARMSQSHHVELRHKILTSSFSAVDHDTVCHCRGDNFFEHLSNTLQLIFYDTEKTGTLGGLDIHAVFDQSTKNKYVERVALPQTRCSADLSFGEAKTASAETAPQARPFFFSSFVAGLFPAAESRCSIIYASGIRRLSWR